MAQTSGFPNLVPAFTMFMQNTEQLVSGHTFAGAINSVGPISTGTIESEPNFPRAVKCDPDFPAEGLRGTFVHGADVIRIDPTGKVAILDFRSVIRTSEKETLYFIFNGYIEGNTETLPILTGHSEAKGYDWGSSYLSGSFETGSEKYKFLTHKVFVGSQRVVKEVGKDLQVEIKLSLVVK